MSELKTRGASARTTVALSFALLVLASAVATVAAIIVAALVTGYIDVQVEVR